jgi:hypothetical protein
MWFALIQHELKIFTKIDDTVIAWLNYPKISPISNLSKHEGGKLIGHL